MEAHLLSRFVFARFQFLLRALEPIRLPAYKGSTLRGGFGHSFFSPILSIPLMN